MANITSSAISKTPKKFCRFYIKPAYRLDTVDGLEEIYGKDYDWKKMHPGEWKPFIDAIKDAFWPTKTADNNFHLDVSVYALPRYFDSVDVGFANHCGTRYNLSIERTPGASITAFGAKPHTLWIVRDGFNKTGNRVDI